ncbi:UNVERIFIED_CONTAM: hypothetical protein PYX00_007915 [Menopon gallinae]
MVVSDVKTETSPLRASPSKKYFWYNCSPCCSEDHSNSLKTIVIVLFGTTGIITLALLTQVYYGEYQVQKSGTVASDSYECSNIGIDVLKAGGNAVDAGIATTFCLGVVNFHVTGIGGGGYFMLYNHKKHKVIDVIDFREVTPAAYNVESNEDLVDGLVVGVPGFVKGLWDAHEKYGKLPWKDLVTPASNLARNGFSISKSLISVISYIKPSPYNSNLVLLLNSLRQGKNVSLHELAATLDIIALKGADAFYNGSIAMDMVYTVKLANGSMSLQDVAQYDTSNGDVLRTQIGDYDVIVPGSSSGGALLLNYMDAIEMLDLKPDVDTSAEIVLKLSDTLHDAYLLFLQKVNGFVEQPEPVGSQVSVVDSEDNYVTITSGLNTWLGSQIMTSYGFILNNAVSNGGLNEERRPVSMASPIIVLQNSEFCGKRYILGSGDVAMAAQLLTNLLIFNRNVSSSIESPRFNIDNIPRHLRLEDHDPEFSVDAIVPLRQLMKIEKVLPPYKSINVIEKLIDSIKSYSDSRGGGRPAQF